MIATVSFPTPWGLGAALAYAFSTSEGLVLIDCGLRDDVAWQTLRDGLQEQGWNPDDIRAVLLTHAHIDHMGLAHRIKDELDADVYVHEAEFDALARNSSRLGRSTPCLAKLLAENGVPVDIVEDIFRPGEGNRQDSPSGFGLPAADPRLRSLKDGDVLSFGDLRLEAIHCPGHSPGSTLFWHARTQTLFTGDSILQGVVPSPIIYFLNGNCDERTRSLPDYLASMARVRSLPARRILPGHGKELDDLPAAIDKLVNHHFRRAERISKVLDGAALTSFEVIQAMFPHIRPEQITMGLFDVIGHLDLLVDQRRVIEEKRGGMYYYRKA